MTRLSRGARAGIAAGLLIAAAATIGATADDHMPPQRVPAPSSPHLVEYGGRLPCTSVQSCRNRLPPGLR
jgi:hypothetical protein